MEEHPPRGSTARFVVPRLATLGDSWIRDCDGHGAYRVLGIGPDDPGRPTLCDRDLNPVAVVTEKLSGPRDSATIDRPGHPSATVRRQSATPGDEVWAIGGHGCEGVTLRGEVLGHRATISSAGRTVATVSCLDHDEYLLTIGPGVDRVLVLAGLIAIERLEH